MWQGSLESNLYEGATVVAAYNAIGYDAAAIGNHEFDFGPVGPAAIPESAEDDARGALKARASESDFPILAANLINTETGQPVDWPNVSPSVLLDVDGVKVGVIGVTSFGSLTVTMPANTKGLEIAPLSATILREATQLRENGAALVIVSAHAGGACRNFADPNDLSSCNLRNEIFRVANELPQGLVDVIVAGHEHEGIAHSVNGTAIISSFGYGNAFGRVDFVIDKNVSAGSEKIIFPPTRICEFFIGGTHGCSETQDADSRVVYAGKPIYRDEKIDSLIIGLSSEALSQKARQIGINVESPMNRTGMPDSGIGNMVTDILLDVTEGADVAILNTLGGVRSNLVAGPLTYGRIYEMLPFDNRIVTVQLSGAELRSVFENEYVNAFRQTANVSGMQVIADCNGDEIAITMIRDDGREIADEDQLTLATIDFLVLGGGRILSTVVSPDSYEFDPASPMLRDEAEQWFLNYGKTIRQSDFGGPDRVSFVQKQDVATVCKNIG
jgi:5'-nucleotidase